MTTFSRTGVKRFLASAPVLLTVALLLFGLCVVSPNAARAQADPQAGTSASAGDEFTRQLSELKKTFGDVGKQIEAGTQSIDRLKSPEQGRKGIEELREHVSKLLATVADNGEVSKLGRMALQSAESKLKSLAQDSRFKPEERDYLIRRWRELKTATEGAIGELDLARRDFAELLHTLQTSEDYIDELLQLREHEKALAVIHQLTAGIRDASDKLKRLLGGIKVPSA